MRSTGSGNTRYENSQTTVGMVKGSEGCNGAPGERLDTGRVGMGAGLNGIIQGAGMGSLFVPLSVTVLATLKPKERTERPIGSNVTATNWLLAAPNVVHLLSRFIAAGRASLDSTVTLWAQIIAHIDDFKLLMIASLADAASRAQSRKNMTAAILPGWSRMALAFD